MFFFGVLDIDRWFLGGGLVFGSLYEVVGGGNGVVDGVVVVLFVVGVIVRIKGKVFWVVMWCDFFMLVIV